MEPKTAEPCYSAFMFAYFITLAHFSVSSAMSLPKSADEPGMTVSLVARRHGVAANQLFTWRRLVAQGSLTAAGIFPLSWHICTSTVGRLEQ